MQEDIEQRTMSVTVQATKLSGRVLKAAIAAALQKMEQNRNTPKVGRNSMKRLTARDPGASTIEVTGRIRSFERIAKKHEVRYHIEKDPGTDPPKWTVYFKANQADALTAAFKEYMYLCDGSIGNDYKVTDIKLPTNIEKRLEALGMTRGTTVTVLNSKSKGVLIVKVRGTRFAFGRNITKNIFVR